MRVNPAARCWRCADPPRRLQRMRSVGCAGSVGSRRLLAVISMSVSLARCHDSPARGCTRAEAEAYVASVCFKHGPPTLLGVELNGPCTVHDRCSVRTGRPHHRTRTDAPQSSFLTAPTSCCPTVRCSPSTRRTVEISSPHQLDGFPFNSVTADADYLQRRLANAARHGTEGDLAAAAADPAGPALHGDGNRFDRIGTAVDDDDAAPLACKSAWTWERHRWRPAGPPARWGRSRGVRQLATALRQAHRVVVDPTQCLLRTDLAHPPPRHPGPGRQLGQTGAGHPGGVHAAGRAGLERVPNGSPSPSGSTALPRPPTLSDLDTT